jgi:hypothetical protein
MDVAAPGSPAPSYKSDMVRPGSPAPSYKSVDLKDQAKGKWGLDGWLKDLISHVNVLKYLHLKN